MRLQQVTFLTRNHLKNYIQLAPDFSQIQDWAWLYSCLCRSRTEIVRVHLFVFMFLVQYFKREQPVLIQLQKERQVRITAELAKNPTTTKTQTNKKSPKNNTQKKPQPQKTRSLHSFKNCCKEIWLLPVQDPYVSFLSWTIQIWLILVSYG